MKIQELIPRLHIKKQKRRSAVGLDIGEDSVKLIELKREGELIKVNKVDSVKVIQPDQSERPLEKNQFLKRTIINLLAKNEIKNKDVILGLNGQSVFIKFLEILPVGHESLDKTLKYEAQQQIPFSLDEIEWDAHLFERENREKSAPIRVLLVAVKKDKLAARRTLAEEIRLRPLILDVSSLSIYNCLAFNRDYDENKLTVVLDIGAQSTDLLIIKGDNLWMRSFALGGHNFTEALRKKFNITFSDAEKLKQRINMDDPDTREAINPVLEDLQGEVARSIEYYYSQQKQIRSEENLIRTMDEILLSGGASLMAGLDKFLRKIFSCQVRLVRPFKMLHLDEEMKKKLNHQNEVLFSQAVGLALRGLSQSRININLLKEYLKKKSLSRQRLLFDVGSVILTLVILFGGSTFMRQDYREKSMRLKRLKGLLNSFSTYQPQVKELEENRKLLSRQIDSLHNLAVNRALWFKVLSEMQKMLPDDLWITEFAGTISFGISSEKNFASKLDLKGKALSYEGVNNFVSRLKSSPLFTEVKPLSSSFVEEEKKEDTEKERVEVVKFSISMKVFPENSRE